MKHNKISVKQNIFDLIPRASSFFLILRDNVENENKKNLSLSKKQKSSTGSETEKFKKKY